MPTPPSRTPQPITVSIVSHGQLALVRPLLEQLDRFSAGSIDKVVLTLNIPEPDVLAGLPWQFPVERIENAAAMGFGANHNQAFRHCDSEWFLVLNPDMRFDNDVLAPLAAQAAPDAGLLTPRILEPGKAQPEQHRAIITPLEILTRKRPGYAIPAVPEWVPGLFMLFRSRAYREVGGFDERFFMYGEDFDICARTQLAGWKLQVAEDLLARHEAQRASHASRRHLYWHVTSLLKVWGSGAFWRFRRAVRGGSQASVL
ncbi:glycosyltransferase [Variovorax sp. J22G21]|uniref:glycosyltransferase family 2 protein n=1 Tax=Variovorax fucosicus TaxID=3053517 RepID=UPI0025752955|nr:MULTISPECIES: glycosyltransferase [unclassified Variovorax]MDM0038506.1 glycosyltransferase [Variovorax sp. J22R193]MDM0063282.1 glycosyltransferase [Variovorax sp. J22G21]